MDTTIGFALIATIIVLSIVALRLITAAAVIDWRKHLHRLQQITVSDIVVVIFLLFLIGILVSVGILIYRSVYAIAAEFSITPGCGDYGP